MLRDYQQRSIEQLYQWFEGNSYGNPCLELPTGSGKSHIVAAFCKEAVQAWPSTKILMCTHVKELVEQNAEKMRQHWPNAPLGIYSAGMRRREVDAITFAGIQSIHNKAHILGHRDLMLVDECHMISNKAQGRYRALINDLLEINPAMRVIGLTATPHRLGQGKITEGADALFHDIITPVTIKELVERGFLAPLKSKHTEAMIDTSRVKKRGGEFIASQMNAAADEITQQAISEIVARAGERRHWLLFCSGVEHSYHCADELRTYGIVAETITAKTADAERERIIQEFKAGRIQALTNADVLTTGFDAPNTDLIAFLRPTMSAALYVQMAGRGMRIKEHTDHCLVLDFAGNVETHGPITGVVPPAAPGEGTGEAPAKTCPECDELVHTSIMDCPECGYHWEAKPKEMRLSNADIMGIQATEMPVTDWMWSRHVSHRSGKEMVKVKYYGGLSDPVITEYHPVTHHGFVGSKALAAVARIADKSGLLQATAPTDDMDSLAEFMNTGKPPSLIRYHKRGKYHDIEDRVWSEHGTD